jgi:hypothetical protein
MIASLAGLTGAADDSEILQAVIADGINAAAKKTSAPAGSWQ